MSRKFWVAAVAEIAFLCTGSVALAIDNTVVSIVSFVCCMFIASVYEVAQATIEITKIEQESDDEV